MNILILDDQPGLAAMLALSLRLSGCTATGFTCPFKALATIQKHDVLITDYHMPEMTGLEVAHRAYDQGWRGSLLIMSGHSKAIGKPLDHPLLHLVLDKPLSAKTLLDALPDPAWKPESTA